MFAISEYFKVQSSLSCKISLLESYHDHMYRKHMLGKIIILSGIIIGENFEKKVYFKITDVCNQPIFQKVKPTRKNKCHILFRKGFVCWKTLLWNIFLF